MFLLAMATLSLTTLSSEDNSECITNTKAIGLSFTFAADKTSPFRKT